MIGLDTNILVAYAIPEHSVHGTVRDRIDLFQREGRRLAVTSGILAEFVHVVTDSRRFEIPLTMTEALEWTAFWSNAEEVAIIATETSLTGNGWLGWSNTVLAENACSIR